MISARIDAYGMAVTVDLTTAIDQVLDLVATAYEDDPSTIGQLLIDLAQANTAADQAAHRDIPDWIADHASAQADSIREDLAAALPSEPVTADLNENDAWQLAGELTTAAGRTFTARARNCQRGTAA
jgi:hypothetical protein